MWCAELLDVPRAPNNGTEGSLHHLLTCPPTLPPGCNGTDYSTGQYPATDRVYETIVNATDTGCDCSKVTSSYDTIRIRVCYENRTGVRARSRTTVLRFFTICASVGKPVSVSTRSNHYENRAILQCAVPSPSKLPLPVEESGPHLIHGSLSPLEPTTQMASRSVQPFLQGSRLCQTDRPTDIPN